MRPCWLRRPSVSLPPSSTKHLFQILSERYAFCILTNTNAYFSPPDAGEASAAAASYCIPGNDDVCFQWGVPEAAAKSGSGNVYFQMRAPTSVQWLGLGIGKRMADAEMFIMYQNGNGNVTLSPRGSTNHAQPRYKERSGVQLLAGSGVVDGNMVANIKCNDCSKLDLDGSGAWLAAWKSGDSLDSTSMSASITYHEGHSQFNVNLGSASITSDSNPFVGSSDDGGSKGGDGGNDGGNSGGNNGGGSNNGDGDSGNSGNGDSGNNNGGSGGAVTGTTGSSKMDMLTSAHGIVMSVVFVVMYPIGAMLMPLLGKWYLHSTWQFLGFLGMWAGFGLGYYVAHRDDIVSISQQPLPTSDNSLRAVC